MMFSSELQRRLPSSAKVASLTLHPGVANTGIGRHLTAGVPAWAVVCGPLTLTR